MKKWESTENDGFAEKLIAPEQGIPDYSRLKVENQRKQILVPLYPNSKNRVVDNDATG